MVCHRANSFIWVGGTSVSAYVCVCVFLRVRFRGCCWHQQPVFVLPLLTHTTNFTSLQRLVPTHTCQYVLDQTRSSYWAASHCVFASMLHKIRLWFSSGSQYGGEGCPHWTLTCLSLIMFVKINTWRKSARLYVWKTVCVAGALKQYIISLMWGKKLSRLCLSNEQRRLFKYVTN